MAVFYVLQRCRPYGTLPAIDHALILTIRQTGFLARKKKKCHNNFQISIFHNMETLPQNRQDAII